MGLAGALELEAVTQALLMTSRDHAEFYDAFQEKRRLRWTEHDKPSPRHQPGLAASPGRLLTRRRCGFGQLDYSLAARPHKARSRARTRHDDLRAVRGGDGEPGGGARGSGRSSGASRVVADLRDGRDGVSALWPRSVRSTNGIWDVTTPPSRSSRYERCSTRRRSSSSSPRPSCRTSSRSGRQLDVGHDLDQKSWIDQVGDHGRARRPVLAKDLCEGGVVFGV